MLSNPLALHQKSPVHSDSWMEWGRQRSFLLESWELVGRNNLRGVLLNKRDERRESYMNALPWVKLSGCSALRALLLKK